MTQYDTIYIQTIISIAVAIILFGFERQLGTWKKKDINRTNNLLTNYRHGFRKGRACVTQLLETIDILYNNTDKGEQQDIIYLDFQKAFD